MKQFLQKTIGNDFALKTVFLVATVIYCIPPLMPAVDTIFTVVLAWTAAFLLYELLARDTYFRGPFYILAALACVAYFATFLVNGRHIIDLKVLFYIITELFLFTGIRSGRSREEITAEITTLARVFVYLSLVISLASLGFFLARWCGIYRNDVTSVSLFLGVHPNGALYGVIGNANRHAWFSLISLAFSFWLLARRRGSWAVYGNAAVQAVVIALTQSRGGLIGAAVLAAGGLLCWAAGRRERQTGEAKRLWTRLAVCICCALVLSVGLRAYGAHFSNITIGVGGNNGKTTVTEGNKGARTEKEKKKNVVGRFEMYRIGGQIVAENPALGVGADDLDNQTRQYMAADAVMNTKGTGNNFHNIFLQTAVQGGLTQTALLCAAVLYALWQIWLGLRRGAVPRAFGHLLALLLALLCINMVEAELYMARNFCSTVFWMLCGYGMALANGDKTYRLQAWRNRIVKRDRTHESSCGADEHL